MWNEVKTVLVAGLNYSPECNPLYLNKWKKISNISVYAKNKDYHLIITKKLLEFKEFLKKNYSINSKIFVDTSPILEKHFAQKAGLGWQGKHTNLVSKKFGSWLFLAEIFLPINLETDEESCDSCGTCKECINICPTGAIFSNHKIDARKCISYLTIEHKGPIPRSLRKLIGNKIYGCDDCLAICPWNKFATPTSNLELKSKTSQQTLDFFLSFNEKIFKEYFKDSPIKRIGWIRFLRNVLISSGNSSSYELVKKISPFLKSDSPLIRGTAIWTLGQLLSNAERVKLKKKFLEKEKNNYVIHELKLLTS